MPRHETTLAVFVASPADVLEERERLDEVVAEINSTWSRDVGVRLELIKWETYAVPDLGADGQDVINRSVPPDFDIFIGIMWQRFGTPTNRAASGTLEEFQAAKKRHDNDPSSVRVMFYFKDEPISPSKIDPLQLQKLADFKKELGQVGLYWHFDDASHFEKLVRIHLQRILQDYKSGSLAPPVQQVSLARAVGYDEELGQIDYIIEFTDRFAAASKEMEEVGRVLEHMTSALSARSEELSRLTATDGSRDYKEAKRVMSALADELRKFDVAFKAPAERSLTDFEAGADAMIRLIGLQADATEEDQAGILALVQTLDTTQHSIREYRATLSASDTAITQWPRMTKEMNVARRELHETLEAVVRRYERAEGLVQEIKEALFALPKRPNPMDDA